MSDNVEAERLANTNPSFQELHALVHGQRVNWPIPPGTHTVLTPNSMACRASAPTMASLALSERKGSDLNGVKEPGGPCGIPDSPGCAVAATTVTCECGRHQI